MQHSAKDILAIHSINMDTEGPAGVPPQSLASLSQLVNSLTDLHTLLLHTFQLQNIVPAYLTRFSLSYRIKMKRHHKTAASFVTFLVNDLGCK